MPEMAPRKAGSTTSSRMNNYLTPSIKRCWVEQAGEFPTHRPLLIEVSVKRMQRTTNQLIKPTNFADMFEAKVQKEIAEAEINLQQQRKDEVQHSGEKRKKQKGVEESEIRKRNLNELHALMDVQIRKNNIYSSKSCLGENVWHPDRDS